MQAIGTPDWMINVPSMPGIYILSVMQETVNTVTESTIFGTDFGIPFIHQDPL